MTKHTLDTSNVASNKRTLAQHQSDQQNQKTSAVVQDEEAQATSTSADESSSSTLSGEKRLRLQVKSTPMDVLPGSTAIQEQCDNNSIVPSSSTDAPSSSIAATGHSIAATGHSIAPSSNSMITKNTDVPSSQSSPTVSMDAKPFGQSAFGMFASKANSFGSFAAASGSTSAFGSFMTAASQNNSDSAKTASTAGTSWLDQPVGSHQPNASNQQQEFIFDQEDDDHNDSQQASTVFTSKNKTSDQKSRSKNPFSTHNNTQQEQDRDSDSDSEDGNDSEDNDGYQSDDQTSASASSLGSSPRRPRNSQLIQSSSPVPSAQPIESGEEDEFTIFNCKCKLYAYAKESKEWKERGVGQLKVNMRHPSDTILSDFLLSDSNHNGNGSNRQCRMPSRQVRLLIRHAIVKKVILNCSIKTGIYEYRITGDSGNSLWLICADSAAGDTAGATAAGQPGTKALPGTFLIRMPTPADCQAVYDLIQSEREIEEEHSSDCSDRSDGDSQDDDESDAEEESSESDAAESDDDATDDDDANDNDDDADDDENEESSNETEDNSDAAETENDSSTDNDSTDSDATDEESSSNIPSEQDIIDSASSDNIQIHQEDGQNISSSSHFIPVQQSLHDDDDDLEEECNAQTDCYDYGSDDIEQSLKSSTFNETSSDYYHHGSSSSISGLASRSYSCYPCLYDYTADAASIQLPSVPYSSIPLEQPDEDLSGLEDQQIGQHQQQQESDDHCSIACSTAAFLSTSNEDIHGSLLIAEDGLISGSFYPSIQQSFPSSLSAQQKEENISNSKSNNKGDEKNAVSKDHPSEQQFITQD